MPTPRGGADVVGRDIAALMPAAPDMWVGGKIVPLKGPDAAAVTLVRFWTEGCPYCEDSLPSLERLRGTWRDQGLETVAVFHPKPPVQIGRVEALEELAREMGYRGPVAADPYWASLKAIWLDGARREATSATFLVDRTGVVRWVHPGPEYFPAGRGDDPQANADYADLELAVRKLLAEAR
jgi:thiol-disulfide isomerase/thioredoxin